MGVIRPTVALLAGFPVHLLPGQNLVCKGTYATWLPQLALRLKDAGEFKFHWFIFDRGISSPRIVEAWNQTFHLLPRWKKSVAMVTAYHSERKMIKNQLRELKPSLVHGWGSEDVYGLAATDWPGDSLISMQGLLFACLQAGGGGFFMRCQELYERRVLSRASHLSIESRWGRDQLIVRVPKASIEQIEYGVNPAYLEVERRPSADGNCVYVGSLSKLKGIDTLLSAFSDERLRSIKLHLVGSGPLAPANGDSSSNIIAHGRLPMEEVIKIMRQSWCLVHPTLVDTSPNCVKEARVMGLPVVTTRSGGQQEYVEEGVSGYFHEPGDVEGIILAVLKATASKLQSLEMGAEGRGRCRDDLDHGRTAESFLKLYRKIMQKSPVITT